jgi:hypothetical protein
MTYRAMGAAPGCPPTSLKPGQRDPCEIKYGFDLPLVGQTEFGLPIPAITNDALLTIEQQLPAMLDNVLPMVEQKIQPYVNSVIADLEYELPSLADQIIKQQVLPELETQKQDLIAQADVMLQKAFLGALAITGVAAFGYWYIKKHA